MSQTHTQPHMPRPTHRSARHDTRRALPADRLFGQQLPSSTGAYARSLTLLLAAVGCGARRSISELALIKQVGCGAASSVYYALCRRTHLPLAVKMYDKSRLSRLNRHQVRAMHSRVPGAAVGSLPLCLYPCHLSSGSSGGPGQQLPHVAGVTCVAGAAGALPCADRPAGIQQGRTMGVPAPYSRPGPLAPQVEREVNIHSSLSHPHVIDFVSRGTAREGGQGSLRRMSHWDCVSLSLALIIVLPSACAHGHACSMLRLRTTSASTCSWSLPTGCACCWTRRMNPGAGGRGPSPVWWHLMRLRGDAPPPACTHTLALGGAGAGRLVRRGQAAGRATVRARRGARGE